MTTGINEKFEISKKIQIKLPHTALSTIQSTVLKSREDDEVFLKSLSIFVKYSSNTGLIFQTNKEEKHKFLIFMHTLLLEAEKSVTEYLATKEKQTEALSGIEFATFALYSVECNDTEISEVEFISE